MVANGAKQIIFNALQAICNPGDEVILPIPYWVSYVEQIRLAGASPVYVQLEFDKGLKIDLEGLKRVIHPEKTKAIILNTPHNPTGGMLNREQLKKIATSQLSFRGSWGCRSSWFRFWYGRLLEVVLCSAC